jgi:hypothetical protein
MGTLWKHMTHWKEKGILGAKNSRAGGTRVLLAPALLP